jgi:2-keto-3-deoxy-L-fuconate dehydrogenase
VSPTDGATRAGGFDGLVAVVTGGASGIGAAVVRALVEQGARVAALDRAAQPGSAPAGVLSIHW